VPPSQQSETRESQIESAPLCSAELTRFCFQLFAIVSDAFNEGARLICGKAEFLGQVTDLIILVTGNSASIGFTDVTFIVCHGLLL
jgi:hypothetical protein